MLVAFSVAPSVAADSQGSVHEAVAAAVRIVRASGLPNHTDSMFTTIEGDWDEVFAVIKAATEAVGAFGPRVSLVLKADIRPGHSEELIGKLERLEKAMRQGESD
ncbi:thiamine-binding protein [Cryobacterium ruanii]|uniref:Thiamine-binding protein n=1 Tax=Cryobacterium ruanii TaxID=1259197 RepID=A0A4R9AKV9_9MICO|nr:thiamine-binding protein [Cryobacterium ruanii]TFD63647.1 thiamine-binding protein [Cryobacterium ruanii]